MSELRQRIDLMRLRPGWHWWRGRGNDRSVHHEGRPLHEDTWCVRVWTHAGVRYASSACWVAPLDVTAMGGEWLGEVTLPAVQPAECPVCARTGNLSALDKP